MATRSRIDTPNSDFPFLPPLSELSDWLGGPPGLHTPLEHLKNKLEHRTPDRKTIQAACSGSGVSRRSMAALERLIVEGAAHFHPVPALNHCEEHTPGTNGYKWEASVPNLIAGINRKRAHQGLIELPRTLAFIGSRARAERHMIQDCTRAQADYLTPDIRLAQVQRVLSDTFHEHTLLPPEEIETYSVAFTRGLAGAKNLDLPMMADFLKARFSLRMDFYHQLLTSVMADMLPLRDKMGLSPSMEEVLVNQGGMGRVIPHLDRGGLVTPSYRLYEFWKHAFSDAGAGPLSYRKMAGHIPTPEAARTRIREAASPTCNGRSQPELRDDEAETKHRRLKEWRRGTIPETDQLTRFLQSMSGEKGDAFLPFLMSRAATAWTKWIHQEQEVLTRSTRETPSLARHIDLAWLIQVFSRYQEYWDRARAHSQGSEPGP